MTTLSKALSGFLGNRLGQTVGFRIFDVETQGRSPLLENPIQFYRSCRIGSSRRSRNCRLQVAERPSGNWIPESRQGAIDPGVSPVLHVDH